MTYATNSILRRCTAQRRIASPLGTLLLARSATGLAGAWFEQQKHHPAAIDAPERDVPLDLQGTPFQRAVWAELLCIAPGATCSYGDIARRLGVPSASRAVGAAVGSNPVSIIVPCHRVVGSTGSLTGYAGGLARKTSLLRIEAERAAHGERGARQLELH
jgi:methylated-DNA-[protein]-cysteine S-methyltransferase